MQLKTGRDLELEGHSRGTPLFSRTPVESRGLSFPANGARASHFISGRTLLLLLKTYMVRVSVLVAPLFGAALG